MKLRSKFIVSITASVLVPVIAISIFSYYTVKQDITGIEGKRLKNSSLAALNLIEQTLVSKKNELKAFSSIDTIRSSLEYDIYDQSIDLLSNFIKGFDGYHGIDLLDKSGEVVSSSITNRITKKSKFIPIEKNGASISRPHYDVKSNKYLINIAVPIYIDSMQIGLLVSSYEMENIFKKLDGLDISKSGATDSGYIMVIHKDGKPIYLPNFMRQSIERFVDKDLSGQALSSLNTALSNKQGFLVEKDNTGNKVLSGYSYMSGEMNMAAVAVNDLSSVLSDARQLLMKISGIAGAFIIAGVLLAIGIARTFIRPLSRVVERLQDIAEGEGDLTIRLDASSSDEVGELSQAFNSFCEKIHNLIAKIAGMSKLITDSSKDMISVAEGVREGANRQASKVTDTSSTVHEMAASVEDVARNASTAAEAANEVSDKVDDGEKSIEMTSAGMTRIADSVKNSFHEVENLGAKVQEIGTIVSVINEVADQTNLLALNAAIEAARAGEQGRGFAVVAEEVRKLAERTNTSTQEIVQMIKNIQNDTTKSITGMKTVVSEVDEGLKLMDKSKEALQAISATADKGTEMATMIASAAEEQSASTREISESMESVSTIADSTDSSSQQMKDASEKLLQLATDMDHMVGVFKISNIFHEKTASLCSVIPSDEKSVVA
jgi:methyl-accepting chemotaxis protein